MKLARSMLCRLANRGKNSSWSSHLGVLLIGLLAVLPIWAQATDNVFYTQIATRLIIFAIAATALNLVLGYGAMISLGHAAFLLIGAYSVVIPLYYEISNGFVHFGLAIGLSALFALVTGSISLRTQGIAFIMITLAFAQMMYFLFASMETYGGTDGSSLYARSEFPGLNLDDNLVFFYLCWSALVLSLFFFQRLIRARFGQTLVGSAVNEARLQSLGVPTFRYRLLAYVLSGTLCGIAGALLANFTYFITPDMMDWLRSAELIFMVVLGGAGSLFGPLIGAASFIVLEEALSGWTLYWHFFFGLFLIIVALFGKGGISALLNRWQGHRQHG